MTQEIKNSKSWKITDYDVSDKRKQFYRDLDKTRMAMGNEICPDTGRHHLQIYIAFARTYSFTSMKKLMGVAHIDIAKVTDWNYELKEGNYELDDRRKQGKRTDISKVKGLLKEGKGMREIVEMDTSYQTIRHAELYLKYKEKGRNFQPEVIWIWGGPGVGKTRLVYDTQDNEEIFRPINFKWWEGYDAHSVVIIDDFRPNYCEFRELLTLLDRYPLRVETKGGSRQLLAKKIFITTPKTPLATYENRSDEDLKQLTRRITRVIHREPRTEVGEGNTDFPDSEGLRIEIIPIPNYKRKLEEINTTSN